MRAYLLITIYLSCFCSGVLAQIDSISTDSAFTVHLPKTITYKEEYYNRSLVFYNTGEYSNAIQLLDSCLQIEPKFIPALYLKAISLQKQGNLKEAVVIFEYIKLLNSSFSQVDKHLRNYYITTYISRNWYYMLAMLLVTVLIIALVSRSVNYRKL